MAVQSATALAATTVTGTTVAPAIVSPFVAQATSKDGTLISGVLSLLTGTGGTLITIQCFSGATSGGTQIGRSQTYTTVAAQNYIIPFTFLDTSVFPGGNQYNISVTENAGTWTVQDGCIAVNVISPAV
jgi:hypothetical protein